MSHLWNLMNLSIKPPTLNSPDSCIRLLVNNRVNQGSGTEWYISSMLYSRDIPFWSGTLEINIENGAKPLLYVMGAQRPILTKKETCISHVIGAQRKNTYTPYVAGAGAPTLIPERTVFSSTVVENLVPVTCWPLQSQRTIMTRIQVKLQVPSHIHQLIQQHCFIDQHYTNTV